MKYLLFKPGFLTEEYMKGRRASYLNPIRMYLFISALFFLLLASVFEPRAEKKAQTEKKSAKNATTKKSKEDNGFTIRRSFKKVAVALDSADAGDGVDTGKTLLKNGMVVYNVAVDTFLAPTVKAYDSLQELLPDDKKDEGFSRYVSRKGIAIGEKSKQNKKEFGHKVMANFYHSLPYMLFLSFPVLALWLKLLYMRRKQYYYVSHAIFVLHVFCTVFIGLLLTNILALMGDWAVWPVIAIYIGILAYLYAAMLRFYKQGWFKTFIKFLLFYLVGSFSVMILALITLINSALNAV